MSAGGSLGHALTPRRPSPQPRHLGGDSTFIQENQVFRRDLADGLEELLALLAAFFRVLLLGVE